MKRNAVVAVIEFSFLSEFQEVFHSFRRSFAEESDVNSTGVDAIDGDVKRDDVCHERIFGPRHLV